VVKYPFLRTVPPFVTVRKFCASRIWSENEDFTYKYKGISAWFMTVGKPHLSKGYQNPKRKLGVPMHFSEIIELKVGKKMPYILCILKLF